jgi:hypothetical protein
MTRPITSPAERIAADFAAMHKNEDIEKLEAASRRLGITLLIAFALCVGFLGIFHDIAARTAATVFQSEQIK